MKKSIRNRIFSSATALVTTAALLAGGVGAAGADPIKPGQPVPLWSGMDVSHYRGPIPQKNGTLLREVPLDKGAWLPAAAKATATAPKPAAPASRAAAPAGGDEDWETF